MPFILISVTCDAGISWKMKTSKRLLIESESFLEKANLVVCVIGCKIASGASVQAIRLYTRSEHLGHQAPVGWRVNQGLRAAGELGRLPYRSERAHTKANSAT